MYAYFRIARLTTLAFALFAVGPALQAEKMRLAVMNVTPGAGVSESVATTVTDLIVSHMVNTDHFLVVERSDLNRVMKEQSLQNSGITETERAVRIGQLLAANKVLLGSVSTLGNRYIINIRIVDVEKASVDFAAPGGADSLEGLERTVQSVVQQIVQRTGSVTSEPAQRRPEPAKREERGFQPSYLAPIPGGAQFARGDTLRGSLFLGSFLVGAGSYFSARAAYNKAVNKNNDILTPLLMASQSGGPAGIFIRSSYFNSIHRDIRSSAASANASLGAVGVIWLWSFIDGLVGRSARPVQAGSWRSDFAILPAALTATGDRNILCVGLQGVF